MRTAITLARLAESWVLVFGPDVPAERQRVHFRQVAQSWPDGIVEIWFQTSDGVASVQSLDKQRTLANQTRDAAQRADQKARIANLDRI
jgi:hypothetical protein